MRDPSRTLAAFQSIDELSRRSSPIHDRHPVALCLATAGFMIAVASFGRRQVLPLVPLFAYPFITMALSDIRPMELLRRLALASPALLGIAALNPIFERAPVSVGPWTVAGGWLSFASLAVKLSLTVSAAFLLVASAGMEGIARSLKAAKVPALLIVVFVTTYRYLSALMSEVTSMVRAHGMRSGTNGGIGRSLWGPMLGGLFLRTYDRAGRIHGAMCLRGFDGTYRTGRTAPFSLADALYCGAWLTFFALARAFDLSQALGEAVRAFSAGAAP